MKEYLKMADVFDLSGDFEREISLEITSKYMIDRCDADRVTIELASKYTAHAINSHDELVAEVERITKYAELAMMTLEEVDRVLTERIKNGAYDLDDISGEVTYALDKLSALE